jgi:hypothetical protein
MVKQQLDDKDLHQKIAQAEEKLESSNNKSRNTPFSRIGKGIAKT